MRQALAECEARLAGIGAQEAEALERELGWWRDALITAERYHGFPAKQPRRRCALEYVQPHSAQRVLKS